MEDALRGLLESLGYPVFRQGSLAGKEYPDSFFTFWNSESPDHAHYDNKNYGTAWGFMVNFYSTDLELVYSTVNKAISYLKSNDWIVPTRGYDIYSGEETHTGRGMTVYYLETV